MEGLLVLLGLGLVVLLLGGSACGIIAMARLQTLVARVGSLERRLLHLKAGRPAEAPAQKAQPPAPPEGVSASAGTAPKPAAQEVSEETPVKSTPAEQAPPAGPPPLPVSARPSPLPKPAKEKMSLEQMLGTKVIAWVAVVMLLLGLGFGLKYAYDNAWIGPEGRLAVGTLSGVAAIIAGERFRRKGWPVLFQTLTGGGIATFYLCDFFSFSVYGLSAPEVSFALACLITVFAVVMAVAHNAVGVAILAVIGGFLSPVLFSTGENHPHVLFMYILILDAVALGAAYFRRWRALDLLCLMGTALMYQGWYMKFYGAEGEPSQLVPALLYTSLFYLVFLLVPLLHSLVRKLPETPEGLTILAANALFSFFCYYNVLFADYRQALAFVVVGQALLILGLFQAWGVRVGKDTRTSESLLTIALALVTIAIPIQLKLYAVPVAWAAEAGVLAFLGLRYRLIICRIGSMTALMLAAGGLLHKLPLHSRLYDPVFNVPFASWAFVAASAGTVAWLVHRYRDDALWIDAFWKGGAVLIAFALGCIAVSFEATQIWRLTPGPDRVANYRTHEGNALVIVWAAIPLLTSLTLHLRKQPRWTPLALASYGVGVLAFLVSLLQYEIKSEWLCLNMTFLPKLLLAVSLWYGGVLARRMDRSWQGNALTVAGHAVLAVLLAFEMNRWAEWSELVSHKIGLSLISAAWGVHAFVLVAIGLVTKNKARRLVGFVLFALTVGKVWLVDLQEVAQVYRIISFMATGFLLLGAAYCYHRFSDVLMDESEQGEGS